MPVNYECDNVRLAADASYVEIIDQTLLPNELVKLRIESAEEAYDAIYRLAVRGAPAIGVFAGCAMAMLALQAPSENGQRFAQYMHQQGEFLVSSRPTAVNLSWAVRRMLSKVDECVREEFAWDGAVAALANEARLIQREDVDTCFAMAELGLSLVEDGWGLITHCNAGPLATSRYGTSLGPMLLGRERGMNFHVFADETRPLLQGARLTTYELDKAGVDVTLICDSMASAVMRQGLVQACFVGCDRVAANGDVANKIGTSQLAIVAARYGVPFYVMCPTSTIDMSCATGDDIPIELRDGNEIATMFYEQRMVPAGVKCYNPSFDVTDNDLVTAIVTEKGIVRAPYSEGLAALMG